MSYPQGYQGASAQPQNNGMGVAGFVCGLVGLVFSFIPLIGLISWPLVIIGIVLSGIGINYVNQGRADNKGLAIAGLVVSIVGLVICILWAVAIGSS
jgi:hypothetical protein